MARAKKQEWSGPLTARQKQSRKISREKAMRKFIRTWSRRAMWVLAVAVAVQVAWGSWWVWKSEIISRTATQLREGAYRMTAQSGFALETIYLEGRNRSSIEDVRGALGVRKGDPILRISMDEVRTRLEALEYVRQASVERALPSTLYIRIEERSPVAIWQHDGKLSLVDEDGRVMQGEDLAAYGALPLVIGADAPKHVKELLNILASEPELAKQIKAVVRMGARRWDVKFMSGVEAKLPEENPQAAWEKLAKLQREQRVLDRDVTAIDLRENDRTLLRLTPGAMTPKQGLPRQNAKDA